jgi:hypothetical protein
VEPHPNILIANEPAMYRGILASELSLLRPCLPVALVEPADLDTAVARLHPRLVICSQLTKIVRQHAAASIVLYPNGTNRAILDVDGQQQVLPNPDLSDLLGAVDAAMERF